MDDEILNDAARLTPDDMLALSREGFRGYSVLLIRMTPFRTWMKTGSIMSTVTGSSTWVFRPTKCWREGS